MGKSRSLSNNEYNQLLSAFLEERGYKQSEIYMSRRSDKLVNLKFGFITFSHSYSVPDPYGLDVTLGDQFPEGSHPSTQAALRITSPRAFVTPKSTQF